MHQCNCNLNVISRRSFLSTSFKTGLAVALSTVVDIPFVMRRALAEGSIGVNGKKLLFIWLRGANDALNSVIPIEDDAYGPSIRPNIYIPKGGVNYTTTGPADFPVNTYSPGAPTDAELYSYDSAIKLGNGFAALHPRLKFLAPVYNAGDLALIHRVGYPRQSRSHFDSQNYWENGNPRNDLVKDGIFYRTMIESGLAHTAPLTGVSIQGSLPLILRGSEAAMTNLTDPERYELLGIPNPAGLTKSTNALNAANLYPFPAKMNRDLLQLQYENLKNTLTVFAGIDFSEGGNTYRDDVVTDNDSDWATANGGAGYYLFPTSNEKNGGWLRAGGNDPDKYAVPTNHYGFFRNLKASALVLNQTDAIIAGTEYGGFDTHATQGGVDGAHANLQRSLGWAIYSLYKFFKRYGKGGSDAMPGAKVGWDDVVVVTLTEFGRTTIENSDRGTDHAEAGVMFVAGGALKGYGAGSPNGAGVFGCKPGEYTGGNTALNWVEGTSGSMFGVSNRYLKRAIDYRSVLGEIIHKHLGATRNQLGRIIPGYADASEHLEGGGVSGIDNTQILGEVGIL
jgi:uncharacterized protein (DUF1501 family)